MANALVEQLRKARPALAEGRSDAELTEFIAGTLQARGDLDAYRAEHPDFNRDLLDLRNAGGDIGRETSTALSVRLRDRLPGSLQNFGALAADALAREQLAQAMGLSAPLGRVGDTLRGMARTNEEEAAARIAEGGGRTIGRIEDVRPTSPRDWALWALPTAAENVPSMVPGVVAGAAAAGLTGGAALPTLLAAGGASFVQNAGDVYGALEEKGGDRGKNIDAALAAGAPMALLDVAGELLPLVKTMGLFKGVPKSAILAKVGEVAGRGGLAGMGRGFVTQALAEGTTESLQELVQIAAEEYATGRQVPADEVASRLRNSAAGGAVVGGVMGGAFGALPERAEARDQKETAKPAATKPPEVEPLKLELPALAPEQVDTLGGKTVKLQAIEGDKPVEVEMDAKEAWTDTHQRVGVYRKLWECMLA